MISGKGWGSPLIRAQLKTSSSVKIRLAYKTKYPHVITGRLKVPADACRHLKRWSGLARCVQTTLGRRVSTPDICRGSERCRRRPTQAMDDLGITQVLGLLSEPSLHHGRKRGGAGGGDRMIEGERQGLPASCTQAGVPEESPGPPVFLNATTS